MAEHSQLPREKIKPGEKFSTANQTIALQTRLILGGDALSPKKTDLGKVSTENLEKISPDTVSKVANASTNERADHWSGKGSYKEQLDSWAASYVAYLGDPTFTKKDALEIYKRYFDGSGGVSNIDQFVGDVLTNYTGQDGKIDFGRLSQEMSRIKRMANIFGGNSAEIIESLIAAQAKLADPSRKQELVTQANEEASVDDSPTLRLNWLNGDENRLLTWLDVNGEKIRPVSSKPTPTKPDTGKYYWKYEKLDGDIRIFPRELTYAKLAHDLRTGNPEQFGNYNIEELSGFVKSQLEATQAELDKFGMTQNELKELSLDFVGKKVLSHYREFIEDAYNIKLPSTENIQVIPISGALAQVHDRTGRGLAFVDTRYPVIFLNVDNLIRSSQQIALKPWESLSIEERRQYFKRLLTEINPHEYTHLLGDIAFWELTSKNPQGKEEELESFTGKLGLKVGKPKNLQTIPNGVQFSYQERGRGLMEAVTVELTQQWVNSMGEELTEIYGRPIDLRLDINAYPAERQVLYALEKLIATENGIEEKKAFETFVRAYFTPNGFKEFVQTLDGRKKKQDGKMETVRPHFTSILYAIMEYEADRARAKKTSPTYPLTLGFISGTLTPNQKRELANGAERIELSREIKNS